MTWEQFKKKVEELGVLNSDHIEYIDIGSSDDFEVTRTRENFFLAKNEKEIKVFVKII